MPTDERIVRQRDIVIDEMRLQNIRIRLYPEQIEIQQEKDIIILDWSKVQEFVKELTEFR